MTGPLAQHAATRLVGDGRLAVRVPAGWPTQFHGGVERSCVVVTPRVVAAVGYSPPGPGLLAVRLAGGIPSIGRLARGRRSTSTIASAAGRVQLEQRVRHYRSEDGSSLGIVLAQLGLREHDGCVLLEGDEALARAVAGSAEVVPADRVVVPNVWLEACADMERTEPTASEVQDLLAAADLVPRVRQVGTAKPGRGLYPTRCTPMAGDVVPRGSAVEVVLQA